MPSTRATRLGYLIAPLFASLAVFAGSAIRGLAAHQPSTDPAHPVLAALIALFAIEMFGAPLAYASAVVVLWPAVRVLRAVGWLQWWTLTFVTTLGGALLFPLYLHWLTPRGSFQFFPGAGAIAGAATGLAFWWIALRPAEPAPGSDASIVGA